MNETEKRRKKLLEEMRDLYQDEKINPAVHPRYKAAYYKIYPDKVYEYKGTFGIRCIFCILILAIYIMLGTENEIYPRIDNLQVQQKIMQNYILELY